MSGNTSATAALKANVADRLVAIGRFNLGMKRSGTAWHFAAGINGAPDNRTSHSLSMGCDMNRCNFAFAALAVVAAFIAFLEDFWQLLFFFRHQTRL
jgi:hypothetical protein